MPIAYQPDRAMHERPEARLDQIARKAPIIAGRDHMRMNQDTAAAEIDLFGRGAGKLRNRADDHFPHIALRRKLHQDESSPIPCRQYRPPAAPEGQDADSAHRDQQTRGRGSRSPV